jgi:hypothetical protein
MSGRWSTNADRGRVVTAYLQAYREMRDGPPNLFWETFANQPHHAGASDF